MCRLVAFAVSLMALGQFSETTALSQDRRGPGADVIIWAQGAGLLGYWQVRDELKLTADQVAKIKITSDKFVADVQAAAKDPKLTPQERRKAMAEFNQRTQNFPTRDILTAEQAIRFRQMRLWAMDHRAFTEPDVIKELKLTDAQVETLKAIDNEFANKVGELLRQNPGFGRIGGGISDEDAAKDKALRAELRATTENECLAVLIDDQKAQFEKMRGPKFEIDMSAFRKRKPPARQ